MTEVISKHLDYEGEHDVSERFWLVCFMIHDANSCPGLLLDFT